jgi:hypothetical protein
MATSARAANTIQNFSAIFPPPAGGCEDPVPLLPFGDVSILPYWDGQGVQLTDDSGSLSRGLALPQMISGAYDSLQIDFQLQITPGANAGADGIGFLYANSSEHGVDNCSPFPNWGTGEEPSLVGSLGVGFDNYNNGAGDANAQNSVSLHWDGAMIGSVAVDDFDPVFLESGDELQASVLITPTGTGSNVSVTLVDLVTGDSFTAFDNEFVDGLTPYDGRPVFMARTGGESAEQAIDNVSLTLTPAGGGDPVNVTENFESYPEGLIDVEAPPIPPNPPLVGGTPYTEWQAGTDPPVRLINDSGAAGAQPGHMQLTSQTNSQLNSIAFDKTSDVADNIQASFKMRMAAGGAPADGVSFLLLDANVYGDDGELTGGFSEEPNLAGALAIGFDNYDNGETGGANHVSLHWDGAQVGENVAIDPAELMLVNGQWNDVQVIATEVEGGMNVTVVITDGTDGSVITPFLDEFVAGASFPDSARAAFGARTGGLSSIQSIDDVLITWTGGGLIGDFNLNGVLDLPDINDLTGQSASGTNNATYDLNSDALVNEADIGVWINDLFNSWVGDANLDGEFNSGDLVSVLASGTYEADVDSVWETGDFNGDGRTTSGDLVAALAGGGYEAGPRAAVAAVPEPAGCTLLLLGGLMLIGRRR